MGENFFPLVSWWELSVGVITTLASAAISYGCYKWHKRAASSSQLNSPALDPAASLSLEEKLKLIKSNLRDAQILLEENIRLISDGTLPNKPLEKVKVGRDNFKDESEASSLSPLQRRLSCR